MDCQRYPDSVILYVRTAMDSAHFYQLKPEINQLLFHLGNCYFYTNHYSLALDHYYQLLQIYQNDQDGLGLAKIHNQIGRTYNYSGDYEKAIQFFYEAIRFAEKIQNRQEYATAINGIGISYHVMGDSDKGRELCTQALAIFTELSDYYGIANAKEHLGIIAHKLKHYDQAQAYYQAALDIKSTRYSHYLYEIAELYDDLVAVYIKQQKFPQAMLLLNKLLEYRKLSHNSAGEANLYLRIANLNIEMGRFDESMPYLNQAYQLFKINGTLRALRDITERLYWINKNHYQNSNQALLYLEKSATLTDSITNTENRSRISNMTIKHETEKSRIQIEKQKFFNRFLLVTILLVSIILIILVYQFRKNRILNRELIVKNDQILQQKNLLQETNQNLVLQHQQIAKQSRNMEFMNQKLNKQNEDLIVKYNEIYQEAIIDKLTQIYNRAYVMDILDREVAKSRRYQSNLCCLLYDIDHFKRVNDNFGHVVGDVVLKQSAQKVKCHIRSGDVYGRWGGEEFIIILPNLNLEEAFLAGEKIRTSISQLNYSFEELQLSITISIGIASIFSIQSNDTQQLIHNADLALYQAKNSGRNQTKIFKQA